MLKHVNELTIGHKLTQTRKITVKNTNPSNNEVEITDTSEVSNEFYIKHKNSYFVSKFMRFLLQILKTLIIFICS
jgi:predicted amino acid racemase